MTVPAITHRAVIETSASQSIYFVASGSYKFCEEKLDWWIGVHGLDESQVGLIVQVVKIKTGRI